MNSKTKKECLGILGMFQGGQAYYELDKYIKLYNLDISHFLTRKDILNNCKISNEIPLEKILVINSTYTSNTDLKKKLLKYNLKNEKCEVCGLNNIWNNNHINLQLDHINGINNDNRLENLRIICPNCHSQTSTFGGRNRKSNKERKKIESEKINYKINELDFIEKQLIKSNIDFSKKTWGVEVSKIMGKSPQYCLKFVKKKLPKLLS